MHNSTYNTNYSYYKFPIFQKSRASIEIAMLSKKHKARLKKIGQNIRRIRRAKDLTLQEVASAVGKDAQSLSRLERGETNATLVFLFEIAEGLNVDITEFFKDIA